MEQSDTKRIFDGYGYIVDKIRNDVIYYYCNKRQSPCYGRAIFKNGTMKCTSKHSHPPDPQLDEKFEFKRVLKYEIKYASPHMSPKVIYDTLRDTYAAAAVVITYPSIVSSMRAWRLEVEPPTPRTLLEFHNTINDTRWQERLIYSRGSMMTLPIMTNNSISLLMLNPSFAKLFANTSSIYIDATFKVTPKINNVIQLFVIMAEKFNHVFPVAWALMPNKNMSTYRDILREFKTLIEELHPSHIHGDFETAMRNAAAAIFPAATFHGCNTHYMRAICKKFRQTRQIRHYYKTLPEVKYIQNKIIALSYLPAHDIPTAYGIIKNTCSLPMQELMEIIFNYFENFWLRRVSPEIFSVHKLIRRTTNNVESHNSLLALKLKVHPSAWEFAAKIVNVLSSSHADFESLRNGRNVSRVSRRRYVIREDLLEGLWDEYDNGMPIEEFLQRAANLNEEVTEILHQDLENDTDSDEEEE